MSRRPRIVIVGAAAGGVTAAEALRHEGFEGEILLLGDEPNYPYLRPPLSKQVLHGDWEPEDLAMRTSLDSLGIELSTSSAAVGLDVQKRVVYSLQGAIPFDELIIATGATARKHPVVPDAHTLRTMSDALKLREALRPARRVAIIGSGILGGEIASAAVNIGAEVLLIGRSESLSFGSVGNLLSARIRELHETSGVQLALGAEVSSADLRHQRAILELHDGSVERADVVVTTIGTVARVDWLKGSGLALQDGVICNSEGLAAPGISAVGDVAAWKNPFTHRAERIEHQSNAIEQAIAVAARVMRGTRTRQPAPFFWSEIHHTRIQAYGWFAPNRPLSADPDDSSIPAPILHSRDDAGATQGLVGWNASPRAFRLARAAMCTSHPLNTH